MFINEDLYKIMSKTIVRHMFINKQCSYINICKINCCTIDNNITYQSIFLYEHMLIYEYVYFITSVVIGT